MQLALDEFKQASSKDPVSSQQKELVKSLFDTVQLYEKLSSHME